jgi:thiol-disulfide isomerase/thioredoxin
MMKRSQVYLGHLISTAALRSTLQAGWRRAIAWLLVAGITIASVCNWGLAPAIAGLTDDRFDGNIFTLYAGNGSLIPPKVKLADSLRSNKPTLLILYTDDSRDCKEYSTIVSQLQEFYGRATDFIALSVDSIPVQESYTPSEPGYYYKGVVPQTLLFNQAGQVVLEASGNTPFEAIDDKFRDIFEMLPRSESATLKRRSLNEVTTELTR